MSQGMSSTVSLEAEIRIVSAEAAMGIDWAIKALPELLAKQELKTMWQAHCEFWAGAEADPYFMMCSRSKKMTFEQFANQQALCDELLMKRTRGEWIYEGHVRDLREAHIFPSNAGKAAALAWLSERAVKAQAALEAGVPEL